MNPAPFSRRLNLEPLEDRAVCSATVSQQLITTPNVSAQVGTDGVLHLNGSRFGDTIDVRVVGTKLRVTGENGTSVNGLHYAEFGQAAFGGVEVNLGGGSDDLTIFGVALMDPGADLRVDTGVGADRVHLDSLDVADELSVVTGAENETGDDTLEVWNSDVYGTMTLRTGGGDDYFDVTFNVARNVLIETGYGEDRGILMGTAAIEDLSVYLGWNSDVLLVDSCLAATMRLDGGEAPAITSPADDMDTLVMGIVGGPNQDVSAASHGFEMIIDPSQA